MKKKTEYRQKQARGLALASAYVPRDLWEWAKREAKALSGVSDVKITASDVLREALESRRRLSQA